MDFIWFKEVRGPEDMNDEDNRLVEKGSRNRRSKEGRLTHSLGSNGSVCRGGAGETVPVGGGRTW